MATDIMELIIENEAGRNECRVRLTDDVLAEPIAAGQLITARAYDLGRRWQSSRTRRKRIDVEVSKYWRQVLARDEAHYESGKETI